jgi:hypothetical protein
LNQRLTVVDTKPTLLDFSLVEEGIREHTIADVSRGMAFARYVVETVFNVPKANIDDHIVDGGQDRGIDIILIDHEQKIINICSCKSVINYKKSSRNFPGDEIDKIASFVDDLLYKRDSLLDSVNGALAAKIREIWEIWINDPYPLKVHLFSNQLPLADAERDRLNLILSRHNIQLLEHGLYELAHGVVRAAKPKFRKKITPIKEDAFFFSENGHRGSVVRVLLSELYNFLKMEEAGDFDERLLGYNVRYFLGMENSVNSNIKETLLSEKAADFWFFNNGITVVCDQILSVGNGCHPITLINPQIVNGGQTAQVIHDIGSQSLLELDKGSISVKVIETSNREFIENIAIASNTQSRIFGRDLRANDPIQTALASLISGRGYFYQRKRGEKCPSGVIDIIDAARAGQLLFAYLRGDPTRSKTNSNDIFDDFYKEVFDPNSSTADLIIAAHRCHSRIEEIRKKAILFQRANSRNSFRETWIIEGHLHVLFAVGEIMRRRSISLEDAESAINLIDEAMKIVEDFVSMHPTVSSYRLFRLASTKEELVSLIDSIGNPTFDHPIQMTLEFDKAPL